MAETRRYKRFPSTTQGPTHVGNSCAIAGSGRLPKKAIQRDNMFKGNIER